MRWVLIVVMIMAAWHSGFAFARCKAAGGSDGRCVVYMMR